MFILIILSSILITISSAILLSINPISLGIIILITALILTLIYSTILTSWVAFLIFLIYVGGILVIFAYFVALTPNQQTNIITIPLLLTFCASILTTLLIFNFPATSPTNTKFIYTFYQANNIQLLLILALILLFTIIVVVKLVTNNKGPLRPFINYV